MDIQGIQWLHWQAKDCTPEHSKLLVSVLLGLYVDVRQRGPG